MKHDQKEGLIQNRLWFLKIINDFETFISITPIDASIDEVISNLDFAKEVQKNYLLLGYYEIVKMGQKVKAYQSSVDCLMSCSFAVSVRDGIMIGNLHQKMKSNVNVAIVGQEHLITIKKGMENCNISYEIRC